MFNSRTLVLVALVAPVILVGSGAALAAYVVIDDFNDLEIGPIVGQNDWHAADLTSVVALDPDLWGLQVLNVVTASTVLYHEATVLEGESRMLFTRFRYEDQLSVSFGMAQSSSPDQFGEFDVELSLTSTRDDLRINDDGTYVVLATLVPGQWYNCWLLVDNKTNTSSVWLHDRANEGATAADQLDIDGRTIFPFRGGTLADMRTFFVKTGGGSGISGPLILDDIYLQDSEGVDLSNPVSNLSSVGAQPTRVQLGDAWPNPFNPSTVINFTLAAELQVRLSVFDVSGRQVRSLIDSCTMAQGTHTMVWDGTDDSGQGMPTGVYLYSLKAGASRQTKRMILVK